MIALDSTTASMDRAMSHTFVRAARGVTLVFLLFAQAATAQNIDLERLNQEMISLYQQDRYDEAIAVGKKALEIAESERGSEHSDVARSLHNLARLYQRQGQYAAAEPLYKRSLAIWEKALGPEHTDVATSLNDLANLYRTQGQYAAADTLYKRWQPITPPARRSPRWRSRTSVRRMPWACPARSNASTMTSRCVWPT